MTIRQDEICPNRTARRIYIAWLPLYAVMWGVTWGVFAGKPAWGRETRSTGVSVDADGIVRRMLSAYQSAQTIRETSEAKMVQTGSGDFVQKSEIKFKRPNLLYASSTDPSLGTYTVFCNGKTVTVYSGKSNIYTKRISPPGLRQTMNTLAKAGETLLGTPINQALSPVSFVSAKGLPDECKKYHWVREEIVGGAHIAVVSGQAELDWLNTMLPVKNVVFERREVTLWIDTNRNVLIKAGFDLRWRADLPARGQNPASSVRGVVRFVETHSNIVLNAPLRDEDFVFIPPPDAIERFQESK